MLCCFSHSHRLPHCPLDSSVHCLLESWRAVSNESCADRAIDWGIDLPKHFLFLSFLSYWRELVIGSFIPLRSAYKLPMRWIEYSVSDPILDVEESLPAFCTGAFVPHTASPTRWLLLVGTIRALAPHISCPCDG